MNICIMWLPEMLNYLCVAVNVGFLLIYKRDKWFSLTFCTFLPETCRRTLSIFTSFWKALLNCLGVYLWKRRFCQGSWVFMRTLCYIQIESYYVIMTLEKKSSCTYNLAWRPPALSDSKALWHSEHRALHCLIAWKQPAEDEDSSTLSFHTHFCFFLLLLAADTFLHFTFEDPLIRHGMDS